MDHFFKNLLDFAKELNYLKINYIKNDKLSMATIIDDNSNIMFDNFIDKNIYQFTCNKTHLTELKNSYEERVMEVFNHQYIIKSIMYKYLIDKTILYQKIFSLGDRVEEEEEYYFSYISDYDEIINPDLYSYAKERNIYLDDIPYYFIYYGMDEFINHLSIDHNGDIMNIVRSDKDLTREFNEIFRDNKFYESLTEYNTNANDDDNYLIEITNNNIEKMMIIKRILYTYLQTFSRKEDDIRMNNEKEKSNTNEMDDCNKTEKINTELIEKILTLMNQFNEILIGLQSSKGKWPYLNKQTVLKIQQYITSEVFSDVLDCNTTTLKAICQKIKKTENQEKRIKKLLKEDFHEDKMKFLDYLKKIQNQIFPRIKPHKIGNFD